MIIFLVFCPVICYTLWQIVKVANFKDASLKICSAYYRIYAYFRKKKNYQFSPQKTVLIGRKKIEVSSVLELAELILDETGKALEKYEKQRQSHLIFSLGKDEMKELEKIHRELSEFINNIN